MRKIIIWVQAREKQEAKLKVVTGFMSEPLLRSTSRLTHDGVSCFFFSFQPDQQRGDVYGGLFLDATQRAAPLSACKVFFLKKCMIAGGGGSGGGGGGFKMQFSCIVNEAP